MFPKGRRNLLLQLDGKLPNLALMRLSAFLKQRGEAVEFRQISSPLMLERGLFDVGWTSVYASLIFERTRPVAERLRQIYPAAIIGGTGWDRRTRLEQFGGTLGYDACATLRLDNGCVASLQYSGSVTRSAADSSLEVIGDSNKLLKATNNDWVTLMGDDPAKIEWNVKQSGPMMWGHQQQDEHFVQRVLAGRRPDILPADARRAMEVALAIAQAGPAVSNSRTAI